MVTGHKQIMKNLELSVGNGHLANCYLFCGDEGVGKKTVAAEFVKMIFCEDEHKPCGKCLSCRKIMGRNHPDVIYVEPTSGKKSIGVDDIRDVISKTYVKPFSADKKVFVVNDAHLISEAAQNVFLKSLEEPPEYVIFILVTQNRGRIIDTVLSRSRIIQFNPNTRAEVEDYLKNEFPELGEKISFAADYASGAIGKALNVLGDESFIELREDLYTLMLNFHSGDSLKAYDLQSFMTENKDSIDKILDLLLIWYTDALLWQIGKKDIITNKDKSAQIEHFCQSVNKKGCAKAIQIILDTKGKFDANANFNLTTLDLSLALKEV